MTTVFPTPILFAAFPPQTSADVSSVLVVSFTALLYLAMTLAPYLREPGTDLPKPQSPEESFRTFDQGEEK